MINVDLTDFVNKLQNFFDCVYYKSDYDFPFLFKYEKTFENDVKKCYSWYDMESEEIPVECENLCNSYWIGTISKHFFGVTQFIKKVESFFWNLLNEVLSK